MKLSYQVQPDNTETLFQRAECDIRVVPQPAVELDFDKVQTVTFPLMIWLVRILDEIRNAGGSCALINPTSTVRRSLQAAGFHRLVRFQVAQ